MNSKFEITPDIPTSGLNLNGDPLSFREGDYSFMLNGSIYGLDGKTPFVRMLPGNLKISNLPAGFYPVGSVAVNHKSICLFLLHPGYQDCQIGLFDGVSYRPVASGKLGFKINKQIQATIDEDFNNHLFVTWVQEDMDVRTMDLNNPPLLNGVLDIDALNLFKKYSYANCKVAEITTNGKIPACSVYITMQYADENSNGLTPWTTPIGPIPIYRDSISQGASYINGSPDRESTNKAIRIELSNLDQSFKYYNIGIIKSFAGIRQAYQASTLPIVQTSYLYTGEPDSETLLDLRDVITPIASYKSAKTICRSNGALLLGNLKARREYNLQPEISKIQVQWQLLTENYDNSDKTYANPLNCVYQMNYRRNEIVALGIVIRWNDGTKSRVYPLIGREINKDSAGNVINNPQDVYGTTITPGEWDTFKYPFNDDFYESTGAFPERYKVYNTAFALGTDLQPGDSGQSIYGEFGYHESTDTYPNKPSVWGKNAGKPIRNFLMPDVSVAPILEPSRAFVGDTNKVRTNKLGIRFANIEDIFNNLPADIKSQIEGWELVRGDRRNNKTIVASGLLYNMWYQNWNVRDALNNVDDIRLYNNYPLNDLNPDLYIEKRSTAEDLNTGEYNDRYRKDVFSFVSPDTEFNKAMLLSGSLYVHGESFGVAKTSISLMKPYARMKHNTQDEDFRDIFYQMISVGFYRNFTLGKPGMLRRQLTESIYIPFNSQVSGGAVGLPVHNLMREGTVMLQTSKPIENTIRSDNSRSYVQSPDFACSIISGFRYRIVASHYASIVNRIPNQYGGIFDIKYVSTNFDNSNVKNNKIVFGGDTFIGSYAMKKQMVMYQNAQEYIGFPDGSRGIDLKNSDTIDGTKFYYTSVPKWIADNSNSECEPAGTGTMYVKMLDAGIPVFFTESDHNMDLRLNGTEPWNTFYPNLKDGSISVQKWTGIEHVDKPEQHNVNPAYEEPNDLYGYQNADPFYDPTFTEGTHYSTRCIFSLSNSPESRVNNLFVFKPLNYYDFRRDAGALWDIEDIGNNRILFRLEHALFVDQKYATIPIENNAISLGSGKLFETDPIMLTKDDSGHLGTNAQWAFNNTTYGCFFIDPVRGTVFQYTDRPEEISANDADIHLAKELPLKLLEDLPWFKDFDNPANPNGVGYTSVFDRFNKVWVLTKRDYSIIDKETIGQYKLNEDGQLTRNNQVVELSDTKLFSNQSWTFMYSPLTKKWVGWASFIPTHYCYLKKEFYSFADNALWQHNKGLPRTFYGKRYPFIFEGAFKNNSGESITHSCNFITRAFPIKNNVQQGESFNETFNKGYFYNEHQHTGMYKLTIQNENDLYNLFKPEQIGADFMERYLRKRGRTWQINELYDLVKDHNELMFITDSSKFPNEYFLDKVVDNSNIDYNRNYIEKPLLRDLWLKYRLIYDLEKDIQLFMYINYEVAEKSIQ